jgi:putative ABC transport system permease protein
VTKYFVTLTKHYVTMRAEACPMRLSALLRDVIRDSALAGRLLRRRRGFAAVALATLALGVGAPVAIFSIVQAVLLRPLPYPDADAIVRFRVEHETRRGRIGFDALPADAALEWSASSATLSSIALYNEAARTLMTADGPVRLTGLSATANLFELLGTPPAAGRTFAADDPDMRQVVLSQAAWQRHFGGASSAVGSLVSMDGTPHRIVGIMPKGFDFPGSETAFWIPVALTAGGTRGMILPAIARLRPGATTAAAIEEGRRFVEESDADRSTLFVRPLREHMVGNVSRTLWILMAAVSAVSVIATVNISLLLLTQGAARAREFSVRLALGATRGSLIRQVSMEGCVIALVGGALGIAVAAVFINVLVSIAPPDIPRLSQTVIDSRVLAFAGGLTLFASLVFAVLSAGRIVAGDVLRTLGGANESPLVAAGVPRRRLNTLATAEVTLAVVLLVGAGLLIRSFIGLVLIDQGFDPRGAVAAQVTLPSSRYPSAGARMAFHERLLERMRQQPGVAQAGVITSMPNRQPTGRFGYDPDAVQTPDPFTMKLAEVRMTSEGFLEAAGIAIVRGRGFTSADTDGAEPVMVISEEMASALFTGQDPIGRTLFSATGNRRVIGIARTVRPAASVSLQHDPSAYLPLRQSRSVLQQFATMTIVVRGERTEALMSELRAAIRALDPELAPFNVRTLDAEVAGLVAGPRFSATVLTLFAAVSLVMAGIGVYGVVAYSAGRRTREIGIRVAVGATPAQVMRLILRDGVAIVLGGLAIGLLLAVWLARTMTGLLHEVTPADPIALASVAALLAVLGLLAIYIPARRAIRISVVSALRDE